MARVAVALAVALVLAGCGSNTDKEKASEQPPASTSGTVGCSPLRDATSNARAADGSRETMFLTSVRVEALECADRVTFGFRAARAQPGYNISYEPASAAKTEDGSGRPIEVAGSAFLVVRLLSAATAETSGEELTPTYTGPRRIEEPSARFVREVAKTGDFEGIVSWAIGLDGRRPYNVTASDSQLVLEFG